MYDDGTFIIADRLRPRVRKYGPNGRLQASQGRFGDGPFEYRRIDALGLDPEAGRVLVYGRSSAHITVLQEDLSPDTTIAIAQPPRFLEPFGGGLARLEFPGAAVWPLRFELTHVDFPDGEIHWRGTPYPPRMDTIPYWLDFSEVYVASTPDLLITAGSFLYPIMVHGPGGAVVAELGTPPPSFREARELAPGEFMAEATAPAAGGGRIEEWLESFTVISGLHIVEDRWLVVGHGSLSWTPARQTELTEYAFDLYDLNDRTKILEDVALPPGAKIMGGGLFLHLLVDGPPSAWTVERLGPRTAGW